MQNSKSGKDDSFSFWKKIIFISVFFAITPIALGTSLLSLTALVKTNDTKEVKYSPNVIQVPRSGIQVFAALPTLLPTVSGEVSGIDARPELVRQFLAQYNSPLEPYAKVVVEAADKYKLDWRLTTAIAMKESGLCKVIPEGSFNCWGWGVHSRGVLGFNSYEDGVEEVSKGLKENYIDEGYTTPEEIMSKYTPLSPGTWADGVTLYMDQMQ